MVDVIIFRKKGKNMIIDRSLFILQNKSFTDIKLQKIQVLTVRIGHFSNELGHSFSLSARLLAHAGVVVNPGV